MSEQPLALRLRGAADRSVELPSSGGLVIGSSAERAGFVVAGADVAEVHCAIGRVKGKQGWAVRDLGSRAGTQLNGRTVSSARLSAGDRLKLGSIELEVFDPQAQSAGSSREEPGTQRVEERSGPRVGGFRIERTLGRGSMGQVFLAVQENLDRRVALKVLPPQVAGDAEFLRRFQSEARAAAALNHPNVVVVYDFGESDGHPWLSMEYMEEGNLEERVAGAGALSWQEVTSILADAAAGLVFAEAQGILHRDIKPANLMRGGAGVVKIADLGLAVSADEADGAGERVFGTPHFMAPEQARGESVDHRADLYALGATAFRLLTGRTPFEGDNTREILRAKLTSDAPAVRSLAPQTPGELDRLVAKLLQREREQRFGSARELAEAIVALQSATRASKDSGAGWKIAAGAILALGAGGYAWWASTRPAEESSKEPTYVASETPVLPAFEEAQEPSTDGSNDDELRVLELEAELALRDLPQNAETQPEARREALLALAERFAGTNAGQLAQMEAEQIATNLSAAENTAQERARALTRVQGDLEAVAFGGSDPAEVDSVAALSAVASYQPDPSVAASEEFVSALNTMRENLVEQTRDQVAQALEVAEGFASEGRFDEYAALLAQTQSRLATADVTPETRAAARSAFAALDELHGQVKSLSDNLEVRRIRWRVERTQEDEQRIATRMRSADGIASSLRAGKLEDAALGLEELASELTFDERGAEIARLAQGVRLGQLALRALVDEFGSGGWRRRSIPDPSSRRSGGLEVVGADSTALTVTSSGDTKRLDWSAFVSRVEPLDQLFRGRLERDYSTEEREGIAALMRQACALEASEILTQAWDAPTDALRSKLELAFETADEWRTELPFGQDLVREKRAAELIFEALRSAETGSWPAAAATIELALNDYSDTLLVNLLSNGESWRPLPPELSATPEVPTQADLGSGEPGDSGPATDPNAATKPKTGPTTDPSGSNSGNG